MKGKIFALLALAIAVDAAVLRYTRSAPPSDLRDAVAEGAPEFNTDVRTFDTESGNIPAPKLAPADNKAFSGAQKAPAATIVPEWFSVSRLSFTMLEKTEGGGFAAVMRSGLIRTTELSVFTAGYGKASAVFTEYSLNPMGAPKNKADVPLITAAQRKEAAAILREVQKNKPVEGAMQETLSGLLSFLETTYAVPKDRAAACPQGFDRLLTCQAAPAPGDNAIVSKMFETISVCGKGKKASLGLSAEGSTEQAPVHNIIVRAGGVEYQVKEPKFNFIVSAGAAPGHPRRGTLQMFLDKDPVEAGFNCGK